MADERLLVANDPLDEEVALGLLYGFEVVQPHSIRGARMVRRNVVTIGEAFSLGLRRMRSEHILFLENDFPLHQSVGVSQLAAELAGASEMLERGASVVFLRSRKQQGCDSFLPCSRPGSRSWVASGNSWATRNNWWSFYCPAFKRRGRVATCLASKGGRGGGGRGGGRGAGGGRRRQRRSSAASVEEPPDARRGRRGAAAAAASSSAADEPLGFRCFTSEDSNWTLNAALLHRERATSSLLCCRGQLPSQCKRCASGAGAEGRRTLVQLGGDAWKKQDALETAMLEMNWGQYRVPLCISLGGLFIHKEVEN